MKQLAYIILGLYTVWFLFLKPSSIELGEGVFAPDLPIQKSWNGEKDFKFNGYRISPLADFEITAKVLSKKNYSSGREADLSPVDLALGWGRMSDESVLDSIKISQSGRWYRWRTAEYPIPRSEISSNSANMHMIPADEFVASQLDRVKQGEVISLSGELVRVDASDGWHWISSLSREDTGGGACEVIFVRDISIQRF